MALTYHSGPGKINVGTVSLFPNDELGDIEYTAGEENDAISSAIHGYVGASRGGALGKVSFTPFRNWSVLPTLFPAWLGVTTGSGTGHATGAILIGTRPADDNTPPSIIIINPVQGYSLTLGRGFLSRPPDLHLGAGKALYGAAEITALAGVPGTPTALGTPPVFHTVTESGASDGNPATMQNDFYGEMWSGAYGAVSDFTAVQAEDEWTISTEVHFSEVKAQRQTLFMHLVSVRFMAKCRPVFPSWQDLTTTIIGAAGKIPGQLFGSPGRQGSTPIDLVLTGTSSGKVITLKNVDIVGAGFSFASNRLGNGEIGFVTQITFTMGVPQPQLIFSA